MAENEEMESPRPNCNLIKVLMVELKWTFLHIAIFIIHSEMSPLTILVSEVWCVMHSCCNCLMRKMYRTEDLALAIEKNSLERRRV